MLYLIGLFIFIFIFLPFSLFFAMNKQLTWKRFKKTYRFYWEYLIKEGD